MVTRLLLHQPNWIAEQMARAIRQLIERKKEHTHFNTAILGEPPILGTRHLAHHFLCLNFYSA